MQSGKRKISRKETAINNFVVSFPGPLFMATVRASVRRAYAVYYVQKSAAYAEITHQGRTADFRKFISTAKNEYQEVLSAE